MLIRVLIETVDTAEGDAVFAACERAAEPLGVALSLHQAASADEFEALLAAPAAAGEVRIVGGRPDHRFGSFGGVYTIAVLPDSEGPAPEGADLVIAGQGMGGYGEAVAAAARHIG